jgi:hypothetical protein
LARTCTICSHDEHHAINVALVRPDRSYRAIAGQFAVSKTALQRHSREHIPQLLVKASEAIERGNADELLARVEDLFKEAKEVLEAAKEAADHRIVLAAIDRASRQLELLGRLRGELNEQPIVNLHLHPEYIEARTLIIRALEPYPQAQTAVVAALRASTGDGHARG